MSSKNGLVWGVEEVFDFLVVEFPQINAMKDSLEITRLEFGRLRVIKKIDHRHLRPGGTVSGPAQMELADLAVYFLLLAQHGKSARLAVTTNLTCSFLNKPGEGDLVCDVEMLKNGKTLSVADVRISTTKRVHCSHLEVTYYTGCVVR